MNKIYYFFSIFFIHFKLSCFALICLFYLYHSFRLTPNFVRRVCQVPVEVHRWCVLQWPFVISPFLWFDLVELASFCRLSMSVVSVCDCCCKNDVVWLFSVAVVFLLFFPFDCFTLAIGRGVVTRPCYRTIHNSTFFV